MTEGMPRRNYLAVESIDALVAQWAIGPLKAHRGCCRQKRVEQKGHFTPKAIWAITDGRFRCKSVSCRPGDPFGCSMAKSRMYRNRTAHLLKGWLEGGRPAYLCLFEARGLPRQRLSAVLRASQEALTSAFTGGWQSAKSKYSIVGRITTLSVSRSSSNGWVVRRWVVLTGERQLERAELQELTTRVRKQWDRTLEVADASFTTRVTELHEIVQAEVSAVSQLINDCISPLDPSAGAIGASLALEFTVSGSEEPASELARRYRAEREHLVGQFKAAPRAAEIGKWQGLFGHEVGQPGRKRFIPLDLPAKSRDFVEYAHSMFSQATFSAARVRGSDDKSLLWNRLIQEARVDTSAPIFADVTYSTRRRRPVKV